MAGLGPGFRGEIFDLPVSRGGEAGEDVAEVGVRVDPAAAAAFDDGVEDGAALASFGGADEEPVFLADGGGTDGVFDEVVVDRDAAVAEVDGEGGPLAEGVVDGLAERALREMAPTQFEPGQGALEAGDERSAVVGADGGAQAGTGALLAQVFFDAVEVLDLPHDPTGGAGARFKGFVELAPRVRPASSQRDFSRTTIGEGGIGAVAVALQGAGKVDGDDVIQARSGAAGLPVKEHVAAGPAVGPKITLAGLAVAGGEIADRGFIHLDIATGHDSGADRLVDRTQPVGGERDPTHHGRAWEMDAVAGAVDLLLPVEREVIAELGDEDLREQARSREAAFLQALGQRGDDGHGVHFAAAHILAPDEPAAQEARGFVIEVFADFLADATPLRRTGLDRRGIEHFLDHRQVLGQPGAALTRRKWDRRAPWLLRCHGLGRFWGRLVHALQKQQQLRGIEPLAFRPEERAHQQVDLLPQERVLLFQSIEPLVAGLEFGQEFSFACASHCWVGRVTNSRFEGKSDVSYIATYFPR